MEAVYEPTGQKILFFGMDDPGKLKSLKVPFGYPGVLWFEELDQFEEEQVRSTEQSVLRGQGPFYCFKSFNQPPLEQHWVNRWTRTPRPGRQVHHSDYTQMPAVYSTILPRSRSKTGRSGGLTALWPGWTGDFIPIHGHLTESIMTRRAGRFTFSAS